jgi:hypothetical protein
VRYLIGRCRVTRVDPRTQHVRELSTDSRDADQSALGILEMADDESVW